MVDVISLFLNSLLRLAGCWSSAKWQGFDMRTVYDAENTMDAYLVKGLLEHSGIPAFVRGEYLTGAIGDLPTSGLVAVCVSDPDWPAAHELLREWREGGMEAMGGYANPQSDPA